MIYFDVDLHQVPVLFFKHSASSSSSYSSCIMHGHCLMPLSVQRVHLFGSAAHQNYTNPKPLCIINIIQLLLTLPRSAGVPELTPRCCDDLILLVKIMFQKKDLWCFKSCHIKKSNKDGWGVPSAKALSRDIWKVFSPVTYSRPALLFGNRNVLCISADISVTPLESRCRKLMGLCHLLYGF